MVSNETMNKEGGKKKRGLAVFYDPHNVYQFLWYYATTGKDIEWDALCLPNSFQGEYISEWSEKLGIFKNIYRHVELYEGWGLKQQLARFLKMSAYALVGQQTSYAKKTITEMVGHTDYDTMVVLTDMGFISGMFLLLGKEKEVIVLEDGTADYVARSYKTIFSKLNNAHAWKGLLLTAMGYNCFGGTYPLRTTKDCIKYCSHPDKMLYRDYREMRTLYDFSNTDTELFNSLMERLFPHLAEFFKEEREAVLFTTPVDDYLPEGYEKYCHRVEDYVNAKYKRIILKKHPRDNFIYQFADDVDVVEIDKSIPAEAMLRFVHPMDLLFMGPSSVNLYLNHRDYKPVVIKFNGLEEESTKCTSVRAQYMNSVVDHHLELQEYTQDNIIYL